jgi:hypothetical protein
LGDIYFDYWAGGAGSGLEIVFARFEVYEDAVFRDLCQEACPIGNCQGFQVPLVVDCRSISFLGQRGLWTKKYICATDDENAA